MKKAGSCVGVSIGTIRQEEGTMVFLHGDGVLGKLVRAFGRKYDRSRMIGHMLLLPVVFR